MSKGYRIYDQHALYFITFSVIDWVDALTRQKYRDIIIDSLKFCITEKELCILAYCLMPNHVHFVGKGNGDLGLSAILRDFKKFTANQILASLKKNTESRRQWMLKHFAWRGKNNPNNQIYQFWQQDNHPIALNNHKLIQQKIDYIHQNPVKAGWVLRPEDYIYSSAGWYYNRSGPLEVEIYSKYG